MGYAPLVLYPLFGTFDLIVLIQQALTGTNRSRVWIHLLLLTALHVRFSAQPRGSFKNTLVLFPGCSALALKCEVETPMVQHPWSAPLPCAVNCNLLGRCPLDFQLGCQVCDANRRFFLAHTKCGDPDNPETPEPQSGHMVSTPKAPVLGDSPAIWLCLPGLHLL